MCVLVAAFLTIRPKLMLMFSFVSKIQSSLFLLCEIGSLVVEEVLSVKEHTSCQLCCSKILYHLGLGPFFILPVFSKLICCHVFMLFEFGCNMSDAKSIPSRVIWLSEFMVVEISV